jgi:hypothetical protein
VSKSYVVNQILSVVRDIIDAVQDADTKDDPLDQEEPGFFVSKIDQVLKLPTLPNSNLWI